MAETRNKLPHLETNKHSEMCKVNTHSETCKVNTQTEMCKASTQIQTCKVNTHSETCKTNTKTETCKLNTQAETCKANTQTETCKTNTTHSEMCKLNTQTETCKANTQTETCKTNTTHSEMCKLNTQTETCKANTQTETCKTNTTHSEMCKLNTQTETCKANTTHSETCKANTQTETCKTNTTHSETCKFSKHTNTCEYKLHVEECLLQLVDFLSPYLALANSHTSDFITKHQWNTYIPAAVQTQLLHLSNDQLLLLPTTTDHLPPQSTSDTTLEEDHISNDTKVTNVKLAGLEQKTLEWNHNNLEEFIKSAHENSLPQLTVLTAIDDLRIKFHLPDDETPFVTDFMSKQKSHEVAVMARLCHSLCKQFGICKVVDLGSGKGYLGTQLAFNYNLKVFGIDSADQNTSGANRRAKILKKQWPGLIKKFTVNQTSYENQPITTEKTSLKIQQSQINRSDNGNLQKYVASITGKESSGFYCPFTTHVNSDTDILQLIAEHDKWEVDAISQFNSCKLLVAGLHTCGNLCSTALRFFSQNPAAHLLCNVSCCYHLLTEEFDPKGDTAAPSTYGFPVSSILRKRKFHLGQNAKNLACQSVNRIVSSCKLTGDSLFQRALLQKIFIDTLSEREQNSLNNSIKLRKLASKCSSFYDYVKMAFQKLDYSLEKISEEMVSGYLMKYEGDKRRLAAFFQVKSALAPCIEALITLDRMYYLLEQESIKDVSLLQLFDPVTSPRCYGIVAVKKIAFEDPCSAVAMETDVTTDASTDGTTDAATYATTHVATDVTT